MDEHQSDALANNQMTAPEMDSQVKGEQADAGNEPLDLDKVEKFYFRGQELTPEEIDRGFMRQQDYTRKTQELSNERKFIQNLSADLESVRDNPQLAEQFKKIYPENYHKFLEMVNKESSDSYDMDDADENSLPPHVMEKLKKLDQIEQKLQAQEKQQHEAQVQAAEKVIDNMFDKFGKQFPYAVEDVVINRVQAMLEENRDNPNFRLTEGTWQRVFKQVNDHYLKQFESRYRSQTEAQLKTSENASDSAPGGMAPGRQPKRLSFEEATEMAIQDLSGRAR